MLAGSGWPDYTDPMRRISFRFDPDKFVEAVAYLVGKASQPCTRMKLAKLLYLADRHHLVRHGTPILGDRYHRLKFGPVPSLALDLLESAAGQAAEPGGGQDPVESALLRYVEVRNPQSSRAEYALRAGAPLRPESLSPSEIASLEAVAAQYGRLDAVQLMALSHRHKAHLDTPEPREIDYRLFFADEPGASEEARSYLEFSQDDRSLVERL